MRTSLPLPCECGLCIACSIRFLEREDARLRHTFRAHRLVENALARVEPSNVTPIGRYSIKVVS